MLKDTIFSSAVKVARKRGVFQFTRREVAKTAETGTGTINYHYGSIGLLRDAVIAHAITTEDVELLARSFGDPRLSRRLSPALKERVAAHIAGN